MEIKTDEIFENLPRAPIVEAVIEIRARATKTLEESSLRSALEPRLAGYTFLDSLREFHGEVKIEGGKPPTQKVSELGWKGVRYRSSDGKHIAQFNRDAFVFSRLEPYVTWDQLFDESQRLWAIFREVAQPVDIQRIGLRYINRIKLPPGEVRFEDFIQPAPSNPRELDLPFDSFMHYDTLAVPDYPFAINVIRTVQRPSGAGDARVALILDIDVFTTQGFDVDDGFFGQRLLEMRWLKNKVFFGSITEKALEMFRC
ncbi:MAG: TIGR04255 family protein [Gammaproteobacteria bacterium]